MIRAWIVGIERVAEGEIAALEHGAVRADLVVETLAVATARRKREPFSGAQESIEVLPPPQSPL